MLQFQIFKVISEEFEFGVLSQNYKRHKNVNPKKPLLYVFIA